MTERRRMLGDDGSVLAETAFTVPIVLVLFLGIIEFGLIYRDYITVSDSAADGARSGAIVGNKIVPYGGGNQSGDFFVIQTLRDSFGGIPPAWIKKIVIFKGSNLGAGDPLSQIPSVCRNGTASSTSDKCNVYNPYQAFLMAQTPGVSTSSDYFKCVSGAGIACGWDPASRKDGTGGSLSVPDIDYLGVYVKLDRPYMAKLFGNNFTLEVAAIQRLEPGFIE